MEELNPPTSQNSVRTFRNWLAAATPLLAVGWYSAFQHRAAWIEPLCQQNPSRCSPGSLNFLDRLALVNYDADADFWSFVTQDASAVLALIVFSLMARRARRFGVFSHELLILIQVTAANGLLNECIRLWIQRPRPFVYLDPAGQGGAPAHYTSFYSGHTSFAALAAACALIAARRSSFSRIEKKVIFALGFILTVSTGWLRVAAGRHFISDTLVGAGFGILLAWGINRLHEDRDSVR
jgi:membrane-associated phospholipid phosphatase